MTESANCVAGRATPSVICATAIVTILNGPDVGGPHHQKVVVVPVVPHPSDVTAYHTDDVAKANPAHADAHSHDD